MTNEFWLTRTKQGTLFLTKAKDDDIFGGLPICKDAFLEVTADNSPQKVHLVNDVDFHRLLNGGSHVDDEFY